MVRSLSLLLILFFILTTSFSTQARMWPRHWWNVPDPKDALIRIGEAQDERIRKRELTFLVWNTHKENFQANWKQDFIRLKRDADFILMQEAVGELREDVAYPEIYRGYHGIIGESFWFDNYRTGNVTLSKYHTQYARVYHSPNREPVVLTKKPGVVTKYLFDQSNKELMVVNIHAINFVSTRKFKKHLKQLAGVISHFNGPVVWAGDFNTWSKKRTRFMRKVMSSLGLKKVSFKNYYRVKTFFGHPLDHFYVRGAEVLDADMPVVHSSDHNPMKVKLRFNL
jgi:endonuclease/exonuclease/phosphatase (EEP) superfamily protein YafD